MLISSYLQSMASTGGMVKAVVIGLGAGLLPLFLHGCLSFLSIEVVEIDPVILDLARDYFDFRENEHLKVHIMDVIQVVMDVATFEADDGMTFSNGITKPLSNGSCNTSEAAGKWTDKVGILIVDVDSSNSRSQSTKDLVVSRMKEVFSSLFSLQLEEDVNEVIFALNTENSIKEDCFPEARHQLSKLLKLKHPERSQNIIDIGKKIKRLK